jgi:hypothetical protein
VWSATANDASNRAANLDQSAPSASGQQSPAATGDTTSTGASQDAKGAQARSREHPPTAAMDRATPTDKSDSSASVKHPPTSQMDGATPDQKAPASASPDAASSGTSIPTAKTRN